MADLDRTFAALSDETRRAIISQLAEGEAPLSELAQPFAMSLTAVSKHVRVLTDAGLDAQAWLEKAASDEVKEQLKANTEAAVKRGVFGAPTMFVGNEMFFGQDRLDFVEEAVKGN